MIKNPGSIVTKILGKSNSNHESLLCGSKACIIFLTIADEIILILIMMHAILQKKKSFVITIRIYASSVDKNLQCTIFFKK